jgi:hypothetical protein
MVDLHNFPWLNLVIMISNHIPKSPTPFDDLKISNHIPKSPNSIWWSRSQTTFQNPKQSPTISNSIWWSQDLKSHSKISQLHLMISRSQIPFQNLPTPFDDLKISNPIPKSPNSIWWSRSQTTFQQSPHNLQKPGPSQNLQLNLMIIIISRPHSPTNIRLKFNHHHDLGNNSQMHLNDFHHNLQIHFIHQWSQHFTISSWWWRTP